MRNEGHSLTQRNFTALAVRSLLARGNNINGPPCAVGGAAPERRDALGGGHDPLAGAWGRLGRDSAARPAA